MAEERDAMIIGGIEARLDRLEQGQQAMREDIHVLKLDSERRFSRLEGLFEQMDKRVENIERAITQIQWSMVSGFLITILAVILTRLLR